MSTQVPRLLYVNFILLAGLTDWFVKQFNPEDNVSNWLAAVVGAFVIRLVLPKLPLKSSVSGWAVGVLFALLFASTIAKKVDHLSDWEPEAVYGAVALLGDAFLQIIAALIRIINKVSNYAVDNPGEAFDQGLEKAEKVATVWVRIKTPILEILNLFKKT